jgi:hypothetical protein
MVAILEIEAYERHEGKNPRIDPKILSSYFSVSDP